MIFHRILLTSIWENRIQTTIHADYPGLYAGFSYIVRHLHYLTLVLSQTRFYMRYIIFQLQNNMILRYINLLQIIRLSFTSDCEMKAIFSVIHVMGTTKEYTKKTIYTIRQFRRRCKPRRNNHVKTVLSYNNTMMYRFQKCFLQ